ncbi:MAG: T9SS type A sorting domain-containing protein [Bacteroidetes bacterium]|nr:T9SS type A sorting domain-containing protein [Bacteroidota bacterium]
MLRLILLIVIVCLLSGISAQTPIGQWNVHVPYQSAVDVAVADGVVWGALEASVIAVDKDDLSMTRYTKANGLSDVEVAAMAYDDETGALVIAYANANVDIIQGNEVTNIPYIQNAFIIGDKSINGIFTNNGTAWLSCGFGIVKLNIDRKEIDDTYHVGTDNTNLQINDIWANDDFIFAATKDGVIRGTIDPFINLSDANNPEGWFRFNFEKHNLPEDEVSAIDVLNGKVYAFIGDELFSLPLNDTSWTAIPHDPDWETMGTTSKGNLLYIAQAILNNEGVFLNSRIGTYDGSAFSFLDPGSNFLRPRNVDVDENGTIWYPDYYGGLTRIQGNNTDIFVANGPYKRTVMGMDYFDGSVYVASSSMSATLSGDQRYLPYGFYRSQDQVWFNFNEYNVPGLAGMIDIAAIEAIPAENKLLLSSHNKGIIEFDLNDRSTSIMVKPSEEDNPYRCIALTGDELGNVWIANAYAEKTPLVCRKPGGSYVNYTSKISSLLGKPINSITVDEFNQIWLTTAGSGVYVYNYNGSLEDESDDVLKAIGIPFNLPSSDARCITTDQDGEVWIGTATGIGVVFCPGAILNNNCIVDRICIPRQDTTNFCDNLFENEIINCITIDPGNRKWIGTNSGIFLQSADGLETIYHFTEDNSPLLSNVIRSVEVDEPNGDVYIGTSKGINSFRAEATFTDEQSSGGPIVYPNPVRPDYHGLIAIRNLPNNANVKIVDAAGHLVHETESIGGQAVWDGLDVHGKRPHSGVYVVLSADDNGKFKRTAKFVFIK